MLSCKSASIIIDKKGRTWTGGYDGQGQVGQGAPEHTTKPVNITKTKISLSFFKKE